VAEASACAAVMSLMSPLVTSTVVTGLGVGLTTDRVASATKGSASQDS
jgi:hypothetical protein